MEAVLTLLGATIAILVTISVEYLRRPKLELSIGSIEDQEYDNRPAKRKRALRLKLENHPLPRWASWMSRNSAMQCGGNITFHHLDGQNVFGRAMTIRWPESPEPLPLAFELEGKKGTIIDPSIITLEQRMDIYPGEAELIDVACRFDDEEECYGWNNESYFSDPRWRNPDWKLEKGRYLVNIIIRSSGQKCTELFRLVGDVGINDFRLEKALKEDYDNINKANR